MNKFLLEGVFDFLVIPKVALIISLLGVYKVKVWKKCMLLLCCKVVSCCNADFRLNFHVTA